MKQFWRIDSRNQNKYKYWYVKISIKTYLLKYKQFKFVLDEVRRK